MSSNRIGLVFLVLVFALKSYAQEKIVTLVTTGTGQTKEIATQAALRSAIEQAFGVFISSKTEILNDQMVSDQITSVSQGNIQRYEITYENPNTDNGYFVTLKAVVSIDKLVSFVESKGVEVEFKGGLFAFNINQQELNEKNELVALENLSNAVALLLDKAFDYTLAEVKDPVSSKGLNNEFRVGFTVEIKANQNYYEAIKMIESTVRNISLSISEAENYRSVKKPIFCVTLIKPEFQSNYGILRSEAAVSKLQEIIEYIYLRIMQFQIENGVKANSGWELPVGEQNPLIDFDYWGYERGGIPKWMTIGCKLQCSDCWNQGPSDGKFGSNNLPGFFKNTGRLSYCLGGLNRASTFNFLDIYFSNANRNQKYRTGIAQGSENLYDYMRNFVYLRSFGTTTSGGVSFSWEMLRKIGSWSNNESNYFNWVLLDFSGMRPTQELGRLGGENFSFPKVWIKEDLILKFYSRQTLSLLDIKKVQKFVIRPIAEHGITGWRN